MTDEQKDERSLFVSGILKRKNDYIFVVKNPEQWQKDENGNVRLTFGTIESKVNKGETVEGALQREFLNNIGTEVHILDSKTSHLIYNGMIDEMSMNSKSNKPLFVYKDEKIEGNKRKYNYTYSFLTDIGGIDEVKPVEKMAVLMMNKQLLDQASKGKLSVKELKKRGGKIISNIALPEEALLSPTPASKGIYICGRQCR